MRNKISKGSQYAITESYSKCFCFQNLKKKNKTKLFPLCEDLALANRAIVREDSETST